MCLRRPFSKPKKKSGFGYKVFGIFNEQLLGECFSEGPDRIPGKWLRTGLPGWHIFLTLEGAKFWLGDGYLEVIVKVRYRKAERQGTQLEYPAITAREIFIPKNWKSQKNNT
jgi:hypothetical protein